MNGAAPPGPLVDDKVHSVADMLRRLDGAYLLTDLYDLARAAGLDTPAGGYDVVQDGQFRWQRRVRGALQHLARTGGAHHAGRARWVLAGERSRPRGALMILIGDPCEVSLTLGATAETLAALHEPADLILTDPPYQLGVGQGDRLDAGRRVRGRDDRLVLEGYVEVPAARSYAQFCADWIGPAAAVLRPGGHLAVVTGPQHAARVQVVAEDAGLTFVSSIVVYRPFPLYSRSPRRPGFSHFVATVLCAGPLDHPARRYQVIPDLPTAASGRAYPRDWWTHIPKYQRVGMLRWPNMLPPALVDNLLRSITRPGDLVVDPYVGGGTVPLVCMQRGRRFAGGDVAPQALAFTVARLTDVADRMSLDHRPRAAGNATQPSLFSPEP